MEKINEKKLSKDGCIIFFENVVLISLFSLRLIKATKYYEILIILRENRGNLEKFSSILFSFVLCYIFFYDRKSSNSEIFEPFCNFHFD